MTAPLELASHQQEFLDNFSGYTWEPGPVSELIRSPYLDRKEAYELTEKLHSIAKTQLASPSYIFDKRQFVVYVVKNRIPGSRRLTRSDSVILSSPLPSPSINRTLAQSESSDNSLKRNYDFAFESLTKPLDQEEIILTPNKKVAKQLRDNSNPSSQESDPPLSQKPLEVLSVDDLKARNKRTFTFNDAETSPNLEKITPQQLYKKLKKEYDSAQTHLKDGFGALWECCTEEMVAKKLYNINEIPHLEVKFPKQPTYKPIVVEDKNTLLNHLENPAKASLIHNIGVACTEGFRSNMEDEHLVTVIDVNQLDIPLFCIFDGHHGDSCAKAMQHSLPLYLKDHLSSELLKATNDDEKMLAIFNVLKHAFVELSPWYREKRIADISKTYLPPFRNKAINDGLAGTTANFAFIFEKKLVVSNLGDSRAVLINVDNAPIALSEDAKLKKDIFSKFSRGVHKRGGKINDAQGIERIANNLLALARAAGHDETTSGVNPRSKIIEVPFTKIPPGKNFVIMACDGFWDVLNSEQAAEAVKKMKHLPCEKIAEHLVAKAFTCGSLDNISVMVIELPKIA